MKLNLFQHINKNLFLRLCLMMGVFTFLYSCKTELVDETTDYNKSNSSFLVGEFIFKELNHNSPNVAEKISALQRSPVDNGNSRIYNDSEEEFTIDSEKYLYIQDSIGNKTYTFKIIREDSSDSLLENLVLKDIGNNEFEAYISTYDSIALTNTKNLNLEDLKNHIKMFPIGKRLGSDIFDRYDANQCEIMVPQFVDIYIPGTVCDGNLHHCYSSINVCTAETCPTPSSTLTILDFVPYDMCQSGGSSTGNGTSSGGVSTGPYNPGGGFGSVANPCNKLKNTNTKFPKLKPALVTITGTTSQNHENGFFIDDAATSSTTNPIQNFPVGTAGTIEINDNPSQKYVVIVHTHDATGATGNGTYSVFTWDDLAKINQLIIKNHIDTSNFIFYVITADGTKYALTIENAAVFQNFFYYLDPNNVGQTVDPNKLLNMQNVFDTYYNKEKAGLISETTNPTNDKVNFLKFLKDTGLSSGVSLFESNSDFTSYSKLSLTSSGTVNSQKCN